jgi:multicomponent K+:H+ antiporter subunit A
MTWQNTLPLLIVLSALIPGFIIFRIDEQRRGLRTVFNLVAALSCVILIGVMVSGVSQGVVFETRLPLLPNMDLVLHADALSLLFVSLSGVLWLLTTIYAIAYLEKSPDRSRFFGFFSLCVSATIGVALAGNLITFLIFYELLTLTTYPLLVHKGNAASIKAGRTYLIYTMIGGALLLAGVAWLKALAGSLDFSATGVLENLPGLDPIHLQIIFGLLIAGLGVKAALVPLHGWLPVAMAAPAPVSALLHAVAVVKAGAFGIVRVVYDVYGIEFARDLGLTMVLAGLASFTIVYGSTRALFQDDLKKRLAYSTVSQVSYIALGTAIAGPIATIGGIVHLVHQGLMKITMFFCAGNLAETLGVHRVSQMKGAGQRMPLTMIAFSLAALSMIGIPPAAGFVSKWYLGVGALEVEAYWIIGVLAISSLLNALYFLPILYAAWFTPQAGPWPAERPQSWLETHWMLLLPPIITACLALLVGLFAGSSISPLSWVKLIAAREYGTEVGRELQNSSILAPMLWWLIVIPLVSTLLLLLKRLRRLGPWLVPLAAAPALVAAIVFPQGENVLPWLFFGSVIRLDGTGQIFLLLAAVLWIVAGLYALDYLRNDPHKVRFTLFMLLAMSGNFGLILAQDMFGFITFFTLMSLSAYGLVIHSGTDEARQAGKTYMQWAIIGEILLFAGMTGLAISNEYQSLGTLDITSQPSWVTGLLLAGFGVKAGVLFVHVWLPRAHPVAPIPASALLSGIMVKAGLLGWIKFLPLGDIAFENFGGILMALGLAGAFLGIIAGVVQRNPKTLLAYSTLSQMGIITAAIGAGLMAPELWPLLLPAILLYAFHHGLAKAALFLSVGFIPYLSHKRYGIFIWLSILLPALALAGLPFTSGALAKTALKASIVDISGLASALQLTAIGTTYLMLRFMHLMREASAVISSTTGATTSSTTSSTTGKSSQLSWAAGVAYTLLLLLSMSILYRLPQAQPFLSALFTGDVLWSALWPFFLGLALYFSFHRHVARIKPLPAGDLVIIFELLAGYGQRFFSHTSQVLCSHYETTNNYLQSCRTCLTWPKKLLFPGELINVPHPGIIFIALLLMTTCLLALG